MFDKKYEDRLRAWVDFRNHLETHDDPIQYAIEHYNRAPLVSIQVDPYDDSTWLDPWQLLQENMYCDFAIILAIGYSLQLTTRFSQTPAEIHICTDKEKSEVKYLLHIDNKVIGYNRAFAVAPEDLPDTLLVEKVYTLKTYQ